MLSTENVEIPSGCWWLNAAPKDWRFSDMALGEEHGYALYGRRGNKRRVFQYFFSAKPGDMVLCYASSPIRQVVAVARITRASDGEKLYFEKLEDLSSPMDYAALKSCPELAHMEFFIHPKGSLFQLKKTEYDFIMKQIRAGNPAAPDEDPNAPYTSQDFLQEVRLKHCNLSTIPKNGAQN